MKNLKIGIVALVRGYNNFESYDQLIQRNKYLYENVKLKANHDYSYILFHEGNISLEGQEYIQEKTKFEIEFIDVKTCFEISQKLEDAALKESGREYADDKGYRLMCRFNTFYIWSYVKKFDYILRVDEDCLIEKFDENQFDIMYKSKIDFCVSQYSIETHSYTNSSLPSFLVKNLNANDDSFYNHKFPYTNVYISRVNFWLEPEINKKLENIALSDEQYIYRWGDLPILGSYLNYFKSKVVFFNFLQYKHLSHGNNVKIKNSMLNSIYQVIKVSVMLSKSYYMLKKLYLKSKLNLQNFRLMINKLVTKEIGTKNGPNREGWLKIKLSNLESGISILDAGAGEAQYKTYCSHLKYTSQDIAKYDGQGDGHGLQTKTRDYSEIDIISDIANIPLDNESFDAIMCIEVFEHLTNPLDALKEFNRILKSGGMLILTAPFNSLTHYAPYHFSTGFTKYFYEHHLKEFEFEIIELVENGSYFEYLAQEARRLSSVGKQYSNKKLNFFEKLISLFYLRTLNKLSKSDTGSKDILNFGIQILAQKK